MESISSTSLAAHTHSNLVFKLRAGQHHHADKVRRSEGSDEFKPSSHGHNRAVQIFRAEMMQRLTVKLSAVSTAHVNLLKAYRNAQAPEDAAADVLTIARQIVEQSDDEPPNTLGRLRRSVDDAASTSKGLAATDEEAAALENTERLVRRGLDELGKSGLQSASALQMKSGIRQRSTIEIRTQEGDTVRFDIRRDDQTSVSNLAVQAATASANITEIAVSSRSRLVLRIEGHLNGAEMEAVQSVFAAAEALADEFFSGDIEAALDIVAGLEFDAEQLARVSMHFRRSERIDASQIVRQLAPSEPQAAANVPAAGVAAEPVDTAAGQGTPGPSAGADIVPVEAKTAGPPAAATADHPPVFRGLLSGFGPLASYLSRIAHFLEETASQFSESMRENVQGTRMRFEMTQSMQLEILRAVMMVNAPDAVEQVAESSGSALQQAGDKPDTDHA